MEGMWKCGHPITADQQAATVRPVKVLEDCYCPDCLKSEIRRETLELKESKNAEHKDAQKAFDILIELCGSMNTDTHTRLFEVFNEGFRILHPTHQQSFGKLLKEIIHHFSMKYEQGYYDMRNEQMCKMCHKAWEVIKDVPLPYL